MISHEALLVAGVMEAKGSAIDSTQQSTAYSPASLLLPAGLWHKAASR